MADWTDPSTINTSVDDPITSQFGSAALENPQAIAEGATGAPRIFHQALRQITYDTPGAHSLDLTGIDRIFVELYGAGGGGGRDITPDIGGGGGAGGYASAYIDTSALSSVDITVGAGGVARTSGTGDGLSAGGGSSIDGILSANGGAAGTNSPQNAAGSTIVDDTSTILTLGQQLYGTVGNRSTAGGEDGMGGVAFTGQKSRTSTIVGSGGNGGNSSTIPPRDGQDGLVRIWY